jgi:hypothetical protein
MTVMPVADRIERQLGIGGERLRAVALEAAGA